MPKGRYKGNKRHFTNFEAMEEQKKKEEKERQWRKEQGETDSEEEEDEDKKKASGSSSSDSESESEGEAKEQKSKGVSSLIECENPNRAANKPKKVTTMNPSTAKVQLSRREREEIEKQRATAHYRKLHAEGRTEEARQDLARLAVIRQQREEAAKKKEEEKKAKEAAAANKREQVARALNKKKT